MIVSGMGPAFVGTSAIYRYSALLAQVLQSLIDVPLLDSVRLARTAKERCFTPERSASHPHLLFGLTHPALDSLLPPPDLADDGKLRHDLRANFKLCE